MTLPTLISSETFQIITAQELRDYLRGDDGEADTTLDFYIKTATEYLEIAAKRTLVRKRYLLEHQGHCYQKLYLPMGHVEAVIIIEIDGTLVNTNDYLIKNDTLHLGNQHYDQIKVTYDVGYVSALLVPHRYKIAVLACAADLFIHRFSSDIPLTATHQLVQHYSQMLRAINI